MTEEVSIDILEEYKNTLEKVIREYDKEITNLRNQTRELEANQTEFRKKHEWVVKEIKERKMPK